MRRVGITTVTIGALSVAGGIVFRQLGNNGSRRQTPKVVGFPAITGTTNLEAWKLYERAEVCFRQFTVDGEKAARAHLTEAIRLDPKFLPAHNLLFAGYVN